MLYNQGFAQASRSFTRRNGTAPYYDCVVLHDIDTLPEYSNISYACSGDAVLRISTYLDRFEYRRWADVLLFEVRQSAYSSNSNLLWPTDSS